jgi:hypothetical protein
MTNLIRSIRPLLLALALTTLPSCTGDSSSTLQPLPFPTETQPVETRLSADEVHAIAETALIGLDEGDYDAFAAAWSAEMRAGVDRAQFEDTRRQVLDAAGHFVSITDTRITPGRTEGTVRFYFLCEFDRASMVLALAFHTDGDEVVGVGIGFPE